MQAGDKPMIRRLLLALFLVTASVTLLGQPARCVVCMQAMCFGSCAGQGCVCMVPPGETSGSCWGASAVPHLVERGYRLAE